MRIKALFMLVLIIILIVSVYFLFFRRGSVYSGTVTRLIVPQGGRLYIKDVKLNEENEKYIGGGSIYRYFDNYNDNLLYSAYDSSNMRLKRIIRQVNLNAFKTNHFYNSKKDGVVYARYCEPLGKLMMLEEKNTDTILSLVNLKNNQVGFFIKPSNRELDFFDTDFSRILISFSYRRIFSSYWTGLVDEESLKIYFSSLGESKWKELDVNGYGATFNPANLNEIVAMGIDKKIFLYNIHNKSKRKFNLEAKYVKWIMGTRELLVVVPKPGGIGGEYADVGVFDLDTEKFYKIMGGYSGVDIAFYE